MNRQIKFRLRIGNKIVGYERWDPEYAWDGKGRWLYSRNNTDWSLNYIPHKEKDQFTGLSDKNGKEIYEGDICRQTFNNKTSIGVVRFSRSQGCLVGLNPLWPHEIEVIGNIYENPELLKG